MRLHDVQVVLSATNTADRIQQLNQQQGQVAQSQNAKQLEDLAKVKLTQTQLMQQEPDSKLIGEKDKRGRNLKKNKKDIEPEVKASPHENDKNNLPGTPSGNIIDIKV